VLRRVGNIVVYLGREAEASAALTTLVRKQSWLADFSLVHPRSAALASPLQSPDSAQHPCLPSNFWSCSHIGPVGSVSSVHSAFAV
jgi:hypothetical protein